MNYKPLNEIIKQRISSSKSKPIRGSGAVPEGIYEATIVGVEPTDTRATIYFKTMTGTHKESVMFQNFEKSGLSRKFETILAALFDNDPEAETAFLNLMLKDIEESLHLTRGMKLEITVKPTPGYVIHGTAGCYQAIDVKTEQVVLDGYKNITELKRGASARLLTPSSMRISDARATHADTNIEALYNARKAIFGSEDSEDISDPEAGRA